MAFDFGCFISYPDDDGELVQRFMGDFTAGLKAHLLGPDKGKKYWWDKEQLDGPVRHPDAIASGMCRSACWILIYYPRYRRSDYCKREYRAMCELEERRRSVLGKRLAREQTMIIPVLLRGHENDLPRKLPDHVTFEDFRRYTVSGPHILRHPTLEEKISLISERVWKVWKVCEHMEDVPSGCDTFPLPEPDESDWGPEHGDVEQARPL